MMTFLMVVERFSRFAALNRLDDITNLLPDGDKTRKQ